jgi:dethiobiotin synthetase
MAELARALGAPVLLVVGLKLGCLNHARLTLEAIQRSGCPFAGWIGNHIDPGFAAVDENLATLTRLLGADALALLPHALAIDNDAAHARDALRGLLAARHRQIA